jgi:hypothetical protein
MIHVSTRLDPHEVEVVLDRLCIRFGVCLPPAEIERLAQNPPTGVDEFTEAALVVEGYGFTKSDPLCTEAREVVAQAFLDHLAKHQE